MRARKSKAGSAGPVVPAIFLVTILTPMACLSPTTSHYTGGQALTEGGGGITTNSAGGGPCAPAPGSFAFCAAAAQSLNLGVSKVFNVNLKAASDFEGDVSLNIQRPELDAADPRATVTTQLNMASVHLTPGATVSVPVRVASETNAPTVNSKFKVLASRVGGPAATSTTEVGIQVLPVYDVYLHGGASPETWDANPVGTLTNFAPHAGGVTVNFYNMDTAATHIIHGNGAVPHQNTATPLARSAGGGVAGGVYTVRFTSTAVQNGSFYCHTHEGSNLARTIRTNQ